MEPGPMDADKPPQGWFVDPFGVHEARWFSQGTPTALVRDGRNEAQDPPPTAPVTGPPVRARPLIRTDPPPPDSSDLPRTGVPDAGVLMQPADFAGTGPPTRPRILRTRWIALGGAVVWSMVVASQFLGSTTKVATGVTGRVRTETVFRSDPGQSYVFLALLAIACLVTGVEFVHRVRAHSEKWGRGACMSSGCIGVLGILSLASVGLGLVILAAMLFVVARPIRRARPIPGDRLVLAPPARVPRWLRRAKDS